MKSVSLASAIDSLVRTLEARDPYVSGHSLRVRRYAVRLAQVVGLNMKLQKTLSLAAKLHDIGKIGLPEGILNKPDVLTDAEYGIVREHPLIGERILSPIIRSRTVLATIRGHHERFDGTGYPDGLKRNDIPLTARVLAIADCYDALTSSRAYRDAWPQAAALEYLRSGSGRQFDPCIVPHFITLIESRRSACAG